ncbi:hypothetical protein F926_00488 [Acinetobacter haemolyticus NIPH 261]|nr:hypothetical protein F926_00488 [Acinetobacter haemolyticus NIPH 261]
MMAVGTTQKNGNKFRFQRFKFKAADNLIFNLSFSVNLT